VGLLTTPGGREKGAREGRDTLFTLLVPSRRKVKTVGRIGEPPLPQPNPDEWKGLISLTREDGGRGGGNLT